MPGSRRVLLAGTFEPNFARNRVVRALLEREGFQVDVLRQSVWGPHRYVLVDQPKLRLFGRALIAYARLAWALVRVQRPAAILVLFPGYFDMPVVGTIARLRRIPVVFDTFISLYDTLVTDRALRRPGSAMSRLAMAVDRIGCRLASIVLADTPLHADFLAELTGVDRCRFRVLWLGAREDVFAPAPDVPIDDRLVVFHGGFIPLQGIETIVRAAALLRDDGIRVRLVGDGQERERIESLVRALGVANVELVGRLAPEQIPREIAPAALCLGIFGTTPKTGRVVPNKVFECLAMSKPVITGDTPAIRSAFTTDEVALVPPGDPDALATAVRALLADERRRTQLGVAGRARFERDYSEAALAHTLGELLDELVAR